jgi:hypothetical protein
VAGGGTRYVASLNDGAYKDFRIESHVLKTGDVGGSHCSRGREACTGIASVRAAAGASAVFRLLGSCTEL